MMCVCVCVCVLLCVCVCVCVCMHACYVCKNIHACTRAQTHKTYTNTHTHTQTHTHTLSLSLSLSQQNGRTQRRRDTRSATVQDMCGATNKVGTGWTRQRIRQLTTQRSRQPTEAEAGTGGLAATAEHRTAVQTEAERSMEAQMLLGGLPPT